MDIGIGNNGNWQHSYRSAALRRKKRAGPAPCAVGLSAAPRQLSRRTEADKTAGRIAAWTAQVKAEAGV